MQQAGHISVLLEEAIEGLAIRPAGVYVDCTFGRGGHSRAILQRLGTAGRLLAIDRDPTAVAVAKGWQDPRFEIVQNSFSHLAEIARQYGIAGQIDGILLDLGVSSPQLDDADRGFSFLHDGPLDMRMNPQQGVSAAEWLAQADEEEIAFVLREYGEERYARRIARAIVQDRRQTPFTRTRQLAELIARVSPAREKHKHPATRSFQAIRIHINEELQEAQQVLDAALEVLAPGGRLVVISFHSLEDRLVKRFIRQHSKPAAAPRGLPLTEAQLHQGIRLRAIGKAIKPSSAEVSANPRARSSVLRIAEKVATEAAS